MNFNQLVKESRNPTLETITALTYIITYAIFVVIALIKNNITHIMIGMNGLLLGLIIIIINSGVKTWKKD